MMSVGPVLSSLCAHRAMQVGTVSLEEDGLAGEEVFHSEKTERTETF